MKDETPVEINEHIVLQKFDENDELVETVVIENGKIIETIKED